MTTDLLSELLPEMAGEVRRWLSTIDRVRLQRVSRQLHARDPGPLLSRVWQDIARPCVSISFGALIFKLVDIGVHELEVPSEVRLTDCSISLVVQWVRLPVFGMKEGDHVVADVFTLQVTKMSNNTLRLTQYSSRYTYGMEWHKRGIILYTKPNVSPPSGFATFYGNIDALIHERSYREEYRHDSVSFKQNLLSRYDTMIPCQASRIPLNETCEQ